MSLINEGGLDRIDADLAELIDSDSYRDTGILAVVVEAPVDSLEAVQDEIVRLGGRTRTVLMRLGAVAAWLPIGGIAAIARFDGVQRISLEETCSIA